LVPAGFNSSGINNVSTDPPIPDTEVQKTLRKGKTHVGGELEGIGRGEASGGEEDGGDLHGWRLDLEIVKANKRHCMMQKAAIMQIPGLFAIVLMVAIVSGQTEEQIGRRKEVSDAKEFRAGKLHLE